MGNPISRYSLALEKAAEIESELKRLNRWDSIPLPKERFENMGAFGENTMSFEQWLQFILIPRIHQIVEENGDFPSGSMLAPYAIRAFDGDPEAHSLHDILYGLDELINNTGPGEQPDTQPYETPVIQTDSVQDGSTIIPEVLYTLAGVLPEYSEADLEAQLQTFDTFLSFLSPKVRPAIGKLLLEASIKTTNPACRERLEKAARTVWEGGRAAEPYDHNAAMKKYMEEHKKSFPPQ